MMKFFIVFAVIAIATALPQPVRLPEQEPLQLIDFRPLFVPQEIVEKMQLNQPDPVYTVKIVDKIPELPVEDAKLAEKTNEAAAYAVKIVEMPEASVDAVKFVDVVAETPINSIKSFQKMPAENVKVDSVPDDSVSPVKFVNMAPEDYEPKIVNRPVQLYDDPQLR